MIIIQDCQVTMDTATYNEMNVDANRFRFIIRAMVDDVSPQHKHMEDYPEEGEPGVDGTPQQHMDWFLKMVDEGVAKQGIQ